MTEFSEHEADGCEAEESERGSSEIFPVLCQPAAAVEPPDGAFDDPSFGQNDKAFGSIGTTNDFSDETRRDARESLMEHRPGIGAITMNVAPGTPSNSRQLPRKRSRIRARHSAPRRLAFVDIARLETFEWLTQKKKGLKWAPR